MENSGPNRPALVVRAGQEMKLGIEVAETKCSRAGLATSLEGLPTLLAAPILLVLGEKDRGRYATVRNAALG